MNDIETRNDIDALMVRFYEQAMSDEVIGYLFTEIAQLDLAKHLPVIGDFWESVIFGTGVYQQHGRNPMLVHLHLNQLSPLLPEHFSRWLLIFNQCVNAMFDGQRAKQIKFRAATIAQRMQYFVSGAGLMFEVDSRQ